MNLIKNYIVTLLKFLICLFVGSIILTIFYYLFLNTKVIKIISIIYLGILFLIFGYREGKKSLKKGFLSGLKIGLIFLISLIIINIIFYQSSFTIVRLMVYLLYLLICILGSIKGINKKNK